jgi:hypothetical protein
MLESTAINLSGAALRGGLFHLMEFGCLRFLVLSYAGTTHSARSFLGLFTTIETG